MTVPDFHLDEDRLATWILDREDDLGERERSHLEGCPLCGKRVEALRRLDLALEDLDLRTVPSGAQPIPPHLSARQLEWGRRHGTRLWAVLGLAAAAIIAFVVPRISTNPRLSWTDPRTSRVIEERAVAILGELPPAAVDSVVSLVVSRGVPGSSDMDPAFRAVRLMGDEQRNSLYRLIQQKLEGERPVGVPGQGGGI